MYSHFKRCKQDHPRIQTITTKTITIVVIIIIITIVTRTNIHTNIHSPSQFPGPITMYIFRNNLHARVVKHQSQNYIITCVNIHTCNFVLALDGKKNNRKSPNKRTAKNKWSMNKWTAAEQTRKRREEQK